MRDEKYGGILCSLNLHEWYYERRRPLIDRQGYITFSDKKRVCLRCRLKQLWRQYYGKRDLGYWRDLKDRS